MTSHSFFDSRHPIYHRPGERPVRHKRILQEHNQDPYFSDEKLKQPAVCHDCGAIYDKGHWHLGGKNPAPENAASVTCPACQRIHDHVPAAYLRISGRFVREHEREVAAIIRHRSQHELREHPLKRIMGIEVRADDRVYSFTDGRLARDIGESLHNAFGGQLDLNYSDRSAITRVRWRRDN